MTLPELGVSLMYWPQFEPLLISCADFLGAVEVQPQGFWVETGSAAERFRASSDVFAKLRSLRQARLVHSVGCPVGGTVGPDPEHVDMLARTTVALGAPWVSEHLSFNRFETAGGPRDAGFLLPPRQTAAGVAIAVRQITELGARLPVPVAIEPGVNYLRPSPAELSDGEFVRNVAVESDCGIVLDLHNVWANASNGRQPVQDFLRDIPLERVWEIHVAGGFEFEGYWLDAHSGLVPEAVLSLASELVPSLPNLRALTFEMMPQYLGAVGLDAVRGQLEVLAAIWQARAARVPAPRSLPATIARSSRVAADELASAGWERTLGSLVSGSGSTDRASEAQTIDPGIGVMRRLAEEFRAGAIVDVLRFTCRYVMLAFGVPFLRALLKGFWESTPPSLFAGSEALAFSAYLDTRRLEAPHLREVLDFERALVLAHAADQRQVVRFSCDPSALFGALESGEAPVNLLPGTYDIAIEPGSGRLSFASP